MTYDAAGGGARTPAGIARQSDVATLLLLRWVGLWVDLVVLTACVLLPGVALRLATGLIGMAPNKDLAGIGILIGLLVAFVYYPITEGLWGRSLGKLVTGLIIVDRKGNPPGFGKAIIRTLTRLVEVNPVLFGGIPAAIFVLVSKERQRLGDMVTETYVISARTLKEAKAASAAAAPHDP